MNDAIKNKVQKIIPMGAKEIEIKGDLLYAVESGMDFNQIREDIGDDDNAGAYGYNEDEFDAALFKWELN